MQVLHLLLQRHPVASRRSVRCHAS